MDLDSERNELSGATPTNPARTIRACSGPRQLSSYLVDPGEGLSGPPVEIPDGEWLPDKELWAKNKKWLMEVFDSGATIIDIGRDPKRKKNRSKFYRAETITLAQLVKSLK